jgi:uncharacterized protein YcbK (DUF882 family)
MKYFTLTELTKSATAMRKKIDNTPTEAVKKNLTALVDKVLDPLREAWGQPIVVSSGYRSPKLNRVVGGVASSQHLLGQAADIHTVSDKPSENKKLYDLIKKLKLPVDQCINEYGYNWIHVSYGPRNRRSYFSIK